MATMPEPGTHVTVDYADPAKGVGTISGTVIAGRYPHMYLNVDVPGYHCPWALPLRVIRRINGHTFEV